MIASGRGSWALVGSSACDGFMAVTFVCLSKDLPQEKCSSISSALMCVDARNAGVLEPTQLQHTRLREDDSLSDHLAKYEDSEDQRYTRDAPRSLVIALVFRQLSYASCAP